MLSFHQVVRSDFDSVNQTIINQLHSDVGLVENIGHYIVDAGGKRLRPLLVLLIAKALAYEGKQHIDLAAIIEFIHTATLLHDDVVDISSLRRGRETANAKWGNAPSVLVGDFLYSRAFQMMVEVGSMELMHILSGTTNVIAEGEVQQLVNIGNHDLEEANYMTVIHKKTAALFEAACETAAVIAKANKEQQQSARTYGYHLGVAFQLVDDVLDYDSNAEDLGKNVGDDLAEGKPTLPLIHAINHGDEKSADIIRNAIEQGSVEKLDEILAIVKASGSLMYTKEKAIQHVQLAKEAIEDFAPTTFKDALIDLANFSVERSF
ncbi:polyprenyl synthetase family protein [Agarilytica rhodophyticola]|uniref:polyprenyl synthetase family protein n=1 Tax=Agarilytica rhodophyticola TaxID=1737490 RepID=UPI000B3455B0|nr:polyprenyl synthetase family protein [Agarilytica rhodophyticola]